MRINPLNTDNPMSFKDAAKVSALAALAIWILTFLAGATMGQIRADPLAFFFDALRTYLISWAGNFITFSSLKTLLKEEEEPDE